MKKKNQRIIIPLFIAIVMIAIFWVVSQTLTSVVVFIPGVVVTYIIYQNTFYKKVPGPDRILPLYLTALGIQFIHFTEEYLTNFTVEVPKLLGQQEYPVDYWIGFNMLTYSVFVFGGIILFKQNRELAIIPLFFIVVGVMLNSIGHIMIAIYVGGYFSGLFSAIIYIAIGPALMKRVFDETKLE